MFSCKFQSTLVLVDVVLMQMRKFFHEYTHGDLTAKVLSLESFVSRKLCTTVYMVCDNIATYVNV